MKNFFANQSAVPHVMEEFITGDICFYDAILNSKSKPLFEAATMWSPSVMDIVLKQLDLSYYTAAHVPEKLRELGRATSAILSAWKSTCTYTTDMMNFVHSTDV